MKNGPLRRGGSHCAATKNSWPLFERTDAGRQHADDRVRRAVEPDRPPIASARAGEPLLPESMAHDDGRAASRDGRPPR